MGIGYDSINKAIEYRVWIHTNNQVISEEHLRSVLDEMIQSYPPANQGLYDALEPTASEYGGGIELNELIDDDEMKPYDIRNQWLGFARYRSGLTEKTNIILLRRL